MKLKNVIFDMDGILFDSERVYRDGMFKYAPKHGIEPSHEVFLQTVGTAVQVSKQIFLEHYGEFDYDAMRADIHKHIFTETQGGRIPLKKGVHNILSFLKEQGVSIALATSTRRATTAMMLEKAQIADYFDDTVCGDEVTRAKPDPEIFLTAMRRLGGTPDDTLVVEDSHNGIRAANAAGIPVLMVPDMLPPNPELTTFAVVEDLDEAQRVMAPLIDVSAKDKP
ncbi:MAG: HAD family hydrolase [Acetanaerobacterium sp.]